MWKKSSLLKTIARMHGDILIQTSWTMQCMCSHEGDDHTATNRSCSYNRHCPKNIAVHTRREREREDIHEFNCKCNIQSSNGRLYGCAYVVVRFIAWNSKCFINNQHSKQMPKWMQWLFCRPEYFQTFHLTALRFDILHSMVHCMLAKSILAHAKCYYMCCVVLCKHKHGMPDLDVQTHNVSCPR